MPLLGPDFDTTQPTDTDLVKLGAYWIRNTRQRVRDFCSVLFNLSTGTLKDNIVPSSALKDVVTAGTYNSVVVNSKGQVTAGTNVDKVLTGVQKLVVYTRTAGLMPDGSSVSPGATESHDSLTGYSVVNTAVYSFTVPTGVRSLFVECCGGGAGSYDATHNGGGGAYVAGTVEVAAGDVFLVWVGYAGTAKGVSDPAFPGGTSKFEFDSSKFLKAFGGQGATASAQGSGGLFAAAGSIVKNYYGLAGQDGAAAVAGLSGIGLPGLGSAVTGLDGRPGFVRITYIVGE